jgi:poly [ADP-ribose] polymerase 6/8
MNVSNAVNRSQPVGTTLEMTSPDEEDELIIEGDDEGFVLESDGIDRFSGPSLESVVNIFSAYVVGSPARCVNSTTFELSLSRSFLPLSLQAVYGFMVDPVLLNFHVVLNGNSWNTLPVSKKVEHPVTGSKYVGNGLVKGAINAFFKPDYRKRSNYRSESYLLTSQGTVDKGSLRQLVQAGFDERAASNALILCKNSVSKAKKFLATGEFAGRRSNELVDYEACPLLYLILEVCEAFLDLPDHCCMCRDKLTPGLKPSLCSKQLCQVQTTSIGLGHTVYQEIQQDPLAADLIVSIFSAAVGTQFLNPRPPGFQDAQILQILQRIPAMANIVSSYKNDEQMERALGKDGMELLRWILFSNRSHLISLPDKLALPEFSGTFQFLSLISSPENEEIFMSLKQQYGSRWLFHGSSGDRWHSILRNGLKNATGTALQANGAARGAGIYMAPDSGMSSGYCLVVPNKYPQSKLGQQLMIISLVEVACIPNSNTSVDVVLRKDQGGRNVHRVTGALMDWQDMFTCTMEAACIVRGMFVGALRESTRYDGSAPNVPSLSTVLEYQVANARR